MSKAWSLFWKLFGLAVVALLAVSVAAGLVMGSPDFIFLKIQQVIALSLGICGFISFVVVPVEMYFEDKRLNNSAA